MGATAWKPAGDKADNKRETHVESCVITGKEQRGRWHVSESEIGRDSLGTDVDLNPALTSGISYRHQWE